MTAIGVFLVLLFATRIEAQQRWKLQHQDYLASVLAHLTPVGRLEATNRLRLAVGLPLRNQAKLDATLKELTDPASPRYHQWLTPEQFTETFGPTKQQYQSVIDHMEAHGLTVAAKYANRALVSVTGPVPNVEKAFGVTMRVYQHPTKKRPFYAADAVPSLDADIPVLGISGLDNYDPPHPMDLTPMSQTYTNGQTYTNYAVNGSGPGGLLMGKDFREAYAPGVSLDGTGQAVALIDGQTDPADFQVYAQDAGLRVPNIMYVYLDGTGPLPQPANDAGEADLDIEMIMSLAPNAAILVYCGEADDCFIQMAIDNKAKQISCSLGWSPASPMLGQEFQEFVAQGQSFFCASGDGGSGGDVANSSGSGPGDAANITVVGGTSLSMSSVGGPWASETTWVGSGGATCVNIPIPSYQQGISMASNQGSTAFRNFPDVAAQADTDIFFIYGGGQSGAVGGTSAAAPLWAAFTALINQQAALKGNPPVGFLNPLIYAIGKGFNYASDFHDITSGNNENGTYPTMFSAVPGYDLCTGWGSPNGQALINALAGANTTPNFSLAVLSSDVTNDQYSYIAPPGVLMVTQGFSATATITIIPGNGFDSSVTLSVTGLPTWVTASFSPASAATTSTVTFAANSTAPVGNVFEVTILGTGGNLTRTTTLGLEIVGAPPENFGFESPSIGSGHYQYEPSGGSWTFSGGTGNGSGIVANGSGFGNPNAPQGVQAAFVQEYGTISQLLSGFSPGTNYTITYAAAQRSGNTQSWNVMMDNTVIQSNASGSASYTTYTTSFTASALYHKLSLVGTDLAGGDNTVFLDNIVFTPALHTNQSAFTLSAWPAGVWVVQGGHAAATITVNPLNGFSNSVSLSASALPSGVTASFNPSSATSASTLTFTAAASAVTGTNIVTVTGTAGSLNLAAGITLIVVNTNQFTAPAIVNPGFESPGLGAGNFEYDPTNASWTFDGASPDGSGLVANGSGFGNPNAPQGAQAAFMEEYGVISQAISGFIPGINYTITYSAAQRGGAGQHGGESWNVMMDGTVIGSFNPGPNATSYANYAANFTAWATTHTLSFAGTDLINGDNTVFLDNVTITVSSNQLPAPGLALTSPVANASFSAPATVNLSASVTTNGNAINSVQFFANSTLIGQAANAPYAYAWTNLSNGSYNVFAQVSYNAGSTVDTAAVNITVTNLSANLGFETPSLGVANYEYNPPGASWNFTGTSPGGAGIMANGSALSNPNAPQGVQAAFIREQGAISQTLDGFTPEVNYTLTYSAAQRPGSAQSWNVMIDNTVLQTDNGPAWTNYTTYAVNFTASAAAHTLSFVGTDLAGGDNTVFLDNITINVNENFGFEVPSLGSGNFKYDPSGGSWTFSGASPDGSGLVANGSGFSNPNAPQGSQAAFVQEYGTITQAIAGFMPGTNYTILFSAAQRPGYRQSWNVTINGSVIGSYYPASSATAYENYSATFTATAATEILAFVGTDEAGGDNTIFIDNVQIYPTPSSAPPVPTGLTATAGNTQVSLTWKASSGATSYNVASATVIGGPYLTVVNVTGTNFLNTGLLNGTTYYYVVSALNANGTGANSSQVSATPQVPPPMALMAMVGNAQVNLSWMPSIGAISYLVQDATVNGGPYSTVANVTGTNSLVTGLNNGTTYYYVVAAMNAGGLTANSSQVSATPPGTALTTVSNFGFESPTNGNYVYDPTGAVWTFGGSSPNGSGIVANGGGFSNPNAPQGVQAAFVQEDGTISQAISGFASGTPCQISFQAAERPDGGSYNVGGESWNVTINGTVIASYNPGESATSYSNYKANFTATAASEILAFVGTDLAGGDNTIFIDDVQIAVMPAAPTGLTATAGNAQVSLNWTASSGATSYNVERSTANGGPYSAVTNVAGTNSLITGLTNGTKYYFVATAQNASGTSANSAQVSATPVSPPVAPTSLVATAGDEQVSLSWTAASGATSYNAQSSTTNGGPYAVVTNVTKTNCVITGLSDGTTYYFVVSALDAGGASPNSSQVTATPQPPAPVVTGIMPGANGQGLGISGAGLPNRSYFLNMTTNLTPPVVWTPIQTNVSDTAGNISFTNLAATNQQQFFNVSAP